jgi:hypothetical protein
MYTHTGDGGKKKKERKLKKIAEKTFLLFDSHFSRREN